MDCSDFRRRFSGEEFYKSGSNGRLYVFNERKSDKDTRHIHKVQQGWKYDGKEIALVLYSMLATCNDNLGGDETPSESKEHRASQGKGGQAGSRFGQGAYNPN